MFRFVCNDLFKKFFLKESLDNTVCFFILGRKGFTKGLCAQCYGTSVMQYSRTIRHEGQGLNEIHFVDKLDEITSYIESVFIQPELTDMFEMRLQEMKKSSRVHQSWNPDYSENGIVSFSEYVSLTVLQSKVLKETPKDRTLVYHDTLGKRLMTKWLSDDKRIKLNNENVYFLQNGLVASKLENVKLPIWNKDQDVAMFEKDLTAFYYNIFQEAEKQHIVNMIMPLYGYCKLLYAHFWQSFFSFFVIICKMSKALFN